MRRTYGALALLAWTGCHDWALVRDDAGAPADRVVAFDAAPLDEAAPDATMMDPSTDVVTVTDRATSPDDASGADSGPTCTSDAANCCSGPALCAPWSNCAGGACTPCGGDHEATCDAGPPCRPGFAESGHSGMCH